MRRLTTERYQIVCWRGCTFDVEALSDNSSATDPACPKGIIQWQHGTYTKNSNGSLSLNPIGVDGRQLLSDPCTYAKAVYTRYDQFELFKVL